MRKNQTNQTLFQHFAPDEREFVERIIDLCQHVEESYAYTVTPFVHKRQEDMIRSIAKHFELAAFSSRQWLTETEFSRVIVAPSYYDCQTDDFEIVLYEIDYPKKFHQLTHAQVLGSLLHGLGIRRDLLGDILIDEAGAYVLVDQRFSDLIEREMTKIARSPVSWKRLDWTQHQLGPKVLGEEVLLLVSSLRLDKLVAAGFSLSRTQASSLVEKGLVRLDYQAITQVAKVVEVGQMISIRGYGRLLIREVLGFSKQGKIKLKIEKIKK